MDKSDKNIKEKKEIIKERIAKTSLNTYRNSSNEENDTIKNKKKNSLIYERKRNINERYNKIYSNNLSYNSSKDSTKIYYSSSNRSLQSIDKNKNVNEKINQDKKDLMNNKYNKKFVAIQNFSRYKKKSVLFYKNKTNEMPFNSNYYINN